MAAGDLTITVANLTLTQNTTLSTTILEAGAAITPGVPVYFNTGDNQYHPAEAKETEEKAKVAAIALTYAGDGEFFVAIQRGIFELGSALVIGKTYVISDTTGLITVDSDATTDWYKTVLGVATTVALLDLKINISGAKLA